MKPPWTFPFRTAAADSTPGAWAKRQLRWPFRAKSLEMARRSDDAHKGRRKAPKSKSAAKHKADESQGTKPPQGRLETAAWFLVAGVILAWPRQRAPHSRGAPQPSQHPQSAKISRPASPASAQAAHLEAKGAESREPGRGRSARGPHEIPLKGWEDIIWRSWTDFNKDNITQVAGGVAFFGLLAIFPAMAAFVSLYGLFSDVATAQKQLSLLAGVIPAETLTLIGDQMLRLATTRHTSLGFAFVVSLLVSLWSANAGMKALFVGLNVAFEEQEKRSFIKLNLISLAFTLGTLLFIALALGAVVVVPVVIAFIGYGGGLLPILRWPLLLLVAIALIAALYRYGPSRQQESWRWISWGSTIAAILWLGVSLLFSLYVSQFAHYDRTYGSLGAVIGFMSWLWISTVALLFGAELNSEIEHQTAVDTTTGPPAPMGGRGASMADTLGAARPAKRAKAT